MNKEQLKQHDVKHDIPFEVKVGRRAYKCKYMKTWTADKISSLIVRSNVSPDQDMKQTMEFISKSGKLAPKAISMLILGSYWKIKLLHWIFWRYLYVTCTAAETVSGLSIILKAMDMSSFFLSTQLVEAMNTMRMKMTQEEVRSQQAEQQLEKTQHSETSSSG